MSDQLVKRLRELSNAVTRADWNEFSMRIPVEKDRDADFVLLQAADKIAALEADAARYRGIRDKLTYVGINAHHKQELWCLRGVFADKGSFDEAIDAAMQVKP